MANVFPFRGIRPQNQQASQVIAPPYDVLSEAEARAIAAANNSSFIRVTRSEVDLPDGADSHGAEAYRQAKHTLHEFLQQGVLVQDQKPCFYLYTQTWQGRTQRGLMALCDVKEYDSNDIKKHELTRPDKEQDRTDHIETLQAQTGLVFLIYRNRYAKLQAQMQQLASLAPAWTVTTEDDVCHQLTVIDDDAMIDEIRVCFAEVDALYIADGHHRSAAASRVARHYNYQGTSGRFLTGIFPDDEMKILAYNRLVLDLHGLSTEQFLKRVEAKFTLAPSSSNTPQKRGEWTMYLSGTWYSLQAKPAIQSNDVVASLDVSILQDHLLHAILGIANPRTDKRIQFVGGIRGAHYLQNEVDQGRAAVAFHLYPTGIDQLLDVADANRLMPPKSTWFEPKLRGGVLVHQLEGVEDK